MTEKRTAEFLSAKDAETQQLLKSGMPVLSAPSSLSEEAVAAALGRKKSGRTVYMRKYVSAAVAAALALAIGVGAVAARGGMKKEADYSPAPTMEAEGPIYSANTGEGGVWTAPESDAAASEDGTVKFFLDGGKLWSGNADDAFSYELGDPELLGELDKEYLYSSKNGLRLTAHGLSGEGEEVDGVYEPVDRTREMIYVLYSDMAGRRWLLPMRPVDED